MADEKKWKKMERELGVAQFERGFGGICPKCRNYNSGDATHCYYCGTPLRKGAAAIAAGRTIAGAAKKTGVFFKPTQAGIDTIKWLGNIVKENVKAKTFETLGLVIVAIILATFGFLWAAIGVILFVAYLYLPTEAEVMARAREQAGEKAGTEFTSDLNSIRGLTEELKTLKEDVEDAENFLKTVGDKDIQTAFAVRKEITEMKRKRDEMKKQRTEISNRVLKKAREKGNQKIIEEVEKIMAEV